MVWCKYLPMCLRSRAGGGSRRDKARDCLSGFHYDFISGIIHRIDFCHAYVTR